MSELNRDEIVQQILALNLPTGMERDVAAIGAQGQRLSEIYGAAALELIVACLPMTARLLDAWDSLPARALRRGRFVWDSRQKSLVVKRTPDRTLTTIAAFRPDRTYDGQAFVLESAGPLNTAALSAPHGAGALARLAVHQLTFDSGAISGAIEAGAPPDPEREVAKLVQRPRATLFQATDTGLRFSATLGSAGRETGHVDISPGDLSDLLHFLRHVPAYLEHARDDGI